MPKLPSRIFDALWSFLFPLRCSGCGNVGSALCEHCIAMLPSAIAPEDDRTFAVYNYGSAIVERAIRNLKYHRRGETAVALAHAGAPAIAEYISEKLQTTHPEALILVPIPQHRTKTNTRGFNQSELVARAVAAVLDGARVSLLLHKTRTTTPQAHMKSKTARLQNLKGSMIALATLDSKTLYVLIDDVTTTGATFTEASRALRAAGARKILCAAVAHGYARRK